MNKEIEENNRKGNQRSLQEISRLLEDLFKKTGVIKGTFHSKMGTVKDRNSKDLIEADEIKKKKTHRRTIQKRSS